MGFDSDAEAGREGETKGLHAWLSKGMMHGQSDRFSVQSAEVKTSARQ